MSASVEVRDATPGQIATAAITVFTDHGYSVSKHTKYDLTFDKPASSWNRFAYGGWTSASSVWERVHMALVPMGQTQTRLECDAHLITDRGEPTEERLKYGHVDQRALQQVLDELAARLSQPPPEPPPVP